jgi:YmgG-like glycine-zipper protein
MKTIKRIVPVLILLVLGAGAEAQAQRTYQGTFQSVRQLILRIENRTNRFRADLDSGLNTGSINSRSENNINSFVSEFDDAVRRLHERFDRRQSTAADVQAVLTPAAQIDSFLRRRQLDTRLQNSWALLRTDLNQLARAYSVSWPQTTRTYPPIRPGANPYPSTANRLTGTYRLDVSGSDDPRDAAERAARNLPASNRDRLMNAITARLESPDQLAIDVRGRTVTIASSRAPQITFEADGRERVETGNTGRTVRARATVSGNQLIVSSTGDRGNDFSVTFEPIDNGQRLSVTRRVYAEGLTQPVVVQSTYTRSSEVAQFDVYAGPGNYPGPVSTSGDFVVPNGELVVATLNDSLSTASSREGDRFSMTVRQPTQFAGATIDGHVSHVERSGRLTGRSVMTLNFDNMRLRDGSTYRFAGIVEGARTFDGNTVRVDNEGTVRDDSQTNKTGQRAAIGTAVGAIIGAIAGGGKGAAIGAIIGAGGGAGSVYVQGRNDLELSRGAELTIRASGPASNGLR